MAENEEKNENVENLNDVVQDAPMSEVGDNSQDTQSIEGVSNVQEVPTSEGVEIMDNIPDVESIVIDENAIVIDGQEFAGSPENIYEEENNNDVLCPQENLDEKAQIVDQQDIPEAKEENSGKKSNKKVRIKIVKKLNVEKNQKAIKRNRRNKIIGKVLACVFVLLFVGSIVGMTAGAYVALDHIWWDTIGEEAGVEFKELFTLFNGVSDTNEGKIVTNGYKSSDLTDFYNNLKRKMFLDKDYDLSISKIISSVMSATKDSQEGVNGTSLYTTGIDGYDLQYVYRDSNGNTVTSDVKPTDDQLQDSTNNQEEKEEFTTGNAELDKLLQEIKFDFSSLENYNGERNILEISDKQLAAVINDSFSALSGTFEEMKELEQTIGKPLNQLLKVKQVIISGKETSTKLKITLSIKVKELLSNILVQKGIPSIVNSILPDKLYASVTAYPYDVTKPIEASINRLEESKVNKIVRIVDVILRKTGQTTSISDMLVQVNGKVVEVLDSAQQKLPITFVPSGSVDLYPIESLMGMLDVDISEQAFLYMLKDIKLPTGESLGLVMPTPEEVKNNKNTFVSELSKKYCLDNSDGKISADNTIKDVMNFASSENALEAIRLKEFDYSDGYSQEFKVRTPYDALAGMLSDYVKGEGLLEEIQADIVKISYTSNGEILSVDIRINLAGMLGFDDDSIMASLIRQLVPEYIYVSANICVNASKKTPTTIEINKAGEKNSKEHLQTLTALATKFGMDTSTLTYESICEKIDSGLQDGLAQMQEKIGCEIIFTSQCAYLPNLFEVVCGTGLLDEDEEHHMEPYRLYAVMKQAYTYEVASEEKNKKDNAEKFIGQLEDKYYLQKGKIVDDKEKTLLQSISELKDTYGTAIDKSRLAEDPADLSELSPYMSAGEFAYLMDCSIKIEEVSNVFKSAKVLGAKISNDKVMLHLQASLYEIGLADGSIADDLSKYSNFIPDYAYITVVIDTVKVKSKDKSVMIILDGMENQVAGDFFSIVRKLADKDSDIEKIEENIDEQIKDYLNKLDGIKYEFTDGSDGGMLVIDNLFNIIAESKLVKSNDPNEHVFTPQEIRDLLQSLYGYKYNSVGGEDSDSDKNPLDDFIDGELFNKFFISEGLCNTLKDAVQNETLLDEFAKLANGDYFVQNIRIDDYVKGGNTIYGLKSRHNVTDTKGKSKEEIEEEIADNFKPKFTSDDIAYLLSSQVAVVGDMSFMTNPQVVNAQNTDSRLTLTLRGKGNMDDENANGLMPEYFYISITIDLGSILSDGSRSDMDVYELGLNSVKYIEGGGDNQDLQLLLDLIGRIQKNSQNNSGESNDNQITLKSIMDKIDNNLNGYDENGVHKEGFKDKIHNKVFTVSFLKDGGLMFNETVYQIALNSIYGVAANENNDSSDVPDEIDFRNGLCKVNDMPDKIEYQGIYLNLAEGNKAKDASGAIEDINYMYALSSPLKKDEKAILSVLGEYAKDYANSIDGKELTASKKADLNADDLRPKISGEELIWLIQSSVSFEADGYSNAVMNALYILDNQMIIIYKSSLDKTSMESDEFNALLPDVMSIIVDIDIDVMDNTEGTCAHININDLKDSEVGAIQSMVQKIGQDEEGGNSQGFEDANKECSDSVRTIMKSLTDNMKVSYEAGKTDKDAQKTEGGVMILDSIYGVAAQKINENKADGETVSADDVKDTLEALFTSLNIGTSEVVSGKDITFTTDDELKMSNNLFLSHDYQNIMLNGAIGSGNIASIINTDELLKSLKLWKEDQSEEERSKILKLEQVALIPTETNDDSTFESIRQALNIDSTKEYFLIALDLDMEAVAGEKMSILPDRMYLTVYMELKGDKKVSIMYNSMSNDKQHSVLSSFLAASRPEGVGGLDLSNTENVKDQIFGMSVINDKVGFGSINYEFEVTLGDLLSSGGAVLPISKIDAQHARNEGVILGKSAMQIDYNHEISFSYSGQ